MADQTNSSFGDLSRINTGMYPHNDFDYSVWTAGTKITLANVPWDSQYRETVWFDSDDHLNRYLSNNSEHIEISRMTYCPVGHPIRISTPFTTANKYNYLWVRNPSQPVRQGETARNFYYFILDVEYVAPNTTELLIQLDVWQTYVRQTKFAKCYVERGHIGISQTYNGGSGGNTGFWRDLLTEPEGFDLGTDYRVSGGWDYDTFRTADKEKNYGVCVVSTTDLGHGGGTKENPYVNAASSSYADGLVSGASIYYCETADAFQGMMGKLSSIPWVAQGIVGVYAVPKVKVGQNNDGQNEAWGNKQSKLGDKVWLIQGTRDQKNKPERFTIKHFRSHNKNVQGRYRYLTKLHCYPYAVVEMTAYNGSSTMIKPENVMSEDFTVNVLKHVFPPNQRIVAYPPQVGKYGIYQEENGQSVFDLGINDTHNAITGEFLGNAVTIADFPQLPIVNDQAGIVLANSAHTRAYEYQSADWSQQRALMQASNARANANTQIQANSEMAQTSMWGAGQHASVANEMAGRRYDLANTQNTVNTVMGAAGSALSLNLGGVVSSLAQGAMTSLSNNMQYGMAVDQTNANLAIQNQMTSRNLATQNSAQRQIADANYGLAKRTASGDYANTIAGLNAKTRDIQMTPPAMQGSFGGDSFNLGILHRMSVYVKLKVICEGALHRIGEYWLRYGYAVNRWARFPSNFLCMSRFTYWKCEAVTITWSRAPQQYREAIKGILERGTTVWGSPDDINNINWNDNVPYPRAGQLYQFRDE